MTKESPERYDGIAQALHWIMALAMIGLWLLGHSFEFVPKGPLRSEVIGLHKAVGVIVLVLAVARLSWRLARPQPSLPATMIGLERLVAKLGHVALYLMMFGLPVDGVLMSQSGDHQVSVFGLVLPVLVDKNDALNGLLKQGHEFLGWTLAVILIGHVAAALRHHLVLKDDVLLRMLPRRG